MVSSRSMKTAPDADDRDAPALAARVQAAFERIRHQRMQGMPFVNEALRVEMVGLRRWRGLWLGVLVTPWFMNLLLLPDRDAGGDAASTPDWPSVPVGATAAFDFPAARLAFISARETGAGEYLACSLFSPMFEFADHESARQTAQACLAALFDAGAVTPAESGPKPIAETVTKRDFLRGRWHGESATASGEQR